MVKRIFVIRDTTVLRYMVGELHRYLREGCVPQCEVREYKKTRSLEQNALLWASLTDISEQVVWHGITLKPEEWKDVLSSSLKKQRAVPGIDGGFVILGARTSTMSIAEMSELMELIFAFGAERGVKFKQQQETA